MPVPSSVTSAWCIRGEAEPLVGGQGTSIRAGSLVLKPQPDERFVIWLSQLSGRVTPEGFRLPAPVPAVDGRLAVDGWYATEFVAGEPISKDNGSVRSWSQGIACSRAFHTAVEREPRPSVLDGRTDPWGIADRAAWGEGDPDVIGPQASPLLQSLRGLVVDEGLTPQLVHGDLAGNMLFADGLAPAVIDFSPYWRPAEYADAIVVVDALLWWQADLALIDAACPPSLLPVLWRSLLARALVFRLLSFDATLPDSHELGDQLPRYARIVDRLSIATSS